MNIAKSLKKLLIASAATLTFIGAAAAQDIYAMADAANAQLAANGKNYRIEMAEYITSLDSEEVGRTLLFSNRGNRQLGFDFVPGDPRSPWSGPGPDITFSIDAVNLTADIAGTGELDEMRASMATWDAVTCSTLPLVDRGNTADVGVVQSLFGFGGTGGVASDVQHAGFLPPGFFLLLGSSNILGVTFTFRFIDGGGNNTDIDNNGVPDAAFREIYYNDGFTWEVDPNDQPGDGRFDLQTVALHEAGHGLSQGHFGSAFRTGTPPDVRLHLAPQAVMNAGYIFGQQTLLGTDNAGHCSNWASWPNN